MPIFFQSDKPLKRRGGAFALAVAVVCFLLAAGAYGFAADIAPGVVPGGDSAVSERPKVLDQVDESAFSVVPPSLPKDESASLPDGMPDVAPSETPSPDAAAQVVQSPPDSPSPDSDGYSPAQARRPVSADTVGAPPAVLPEKDDLPSAAAAEPPAASSASAASKIKLFGTVEFKRKIFDDRIIFAVAGFLQKFRRDLPIIFLAPIVYVLTIRPGVPERIDVAQKIHGIFTLGFLLELRPGHLLVEMFFRQKQCV